MNVLAFGGGTDSTAILCGWVEKGYQAIDPIDLILFADTGGERPWTYEHIERMQVWLNLHGMPPITVIRATRKDGSEFTLEQDCVENGRLPSLAYGFKTCSQKFKVAPQDKFLNNYAPAKAWWRKKRGSDAERKITKLIGYEYSEKHRWMKAPLEDEKYFYEFPLVEWGWSRPDCLAAISRAGIPLPGKSSCFFCPATKKPELDALAAEFPELLRRAVAMEANARGSLKTSKGLGRYFNWGEYLAGTLDDDSDQSDAAVCMYCVD